MKLRRLNPISQEQFDFLLHGQGQKDTLHEILFAGGFGCGKSFAGLGKVIQHLAYPRTEAIICRQNAADCWRTTMALMLDGDAITPPLLPPSTHKRPNRIESSVTLYNGSKIWVYGLEDLHKVRSRSASCALLDESTSAKEEGWEELYRRCRIPHPLGNWCGALCNTTDESSWCANRWRIPARGRKCFIGKTLDNAAHLSEGYVNAVKSATKEEQDYLYNGIWRPAKGNVFFAWHGAQDFDLKELDIEVFFISQDYGGGAGCAAMLFLAADTKGRLYVIDEWGGDRRTHAQVHERMDKFRDLTGCGRVVYDPANAALMLEMIERGWECIKPDKSVGTGISLINSALSRKDLLVHPNCVKLSKDLTSAKYNALGMIDKKKGWDYLDCLRYACMEALKASRWYLPK